MRIIVSVILSSFILFASCSGGSSSNKRELVTEDVKGHVESLLGEKNIELEWNAFVDIVSSWFDENMDSDFEVQVGNTQWCTSFQANAELKKLRDNYYARPADLVYVMNTFADDPKTFLKSFSDYSLGFSPLTLPSGQSEKEFYDDQICYSLCEAATFDDGEDVDALTEIGRYILGRAFTHARASANAIIIKNQEYVKNDKGGYWKTDTDYGTFYSKISKDPDTGELECETVDSIEEL